MLIFFAAVSIFVSILAVVIGIYILNSKPKAQGTNGDLDDKTKDEVRDIWMMLGLVDDSTNITRAVCAGPTGKGEIVTYLRYRKKWNPTTGRFDDLKPDEPYPEEEPGEFGASIKKLIRENTGKRVYGYPFLKSLKPVTIDRLVPVPTNIKQNILKQKGDDAPKILQTLTGSTVRRFGFYETIIRPTFHIDVDSSDGTRFTTVSTLIIDMVDPRPGFEKFPDSLLQSISEIVENFFSSKVNNIKYEDYKKMGTNGHKFDDLSDLQKLLEPLGVVVKQFTVSDPELNKAVQEARDARSNAVANAETTVMNAQAKADARKKEAHGEAKYITTVGNANAEVIERTAKATAKKVEKLFRFYKDKGFSDIAAIKEANAFLNEQANAGPYGNLKFLSTTETPSGGVGLQPTIPVEKSKDENKKGSGKK